MIAPCICIVRHPCGDFCTSLDLYEREEMETRAMEESRKHPQIVYIIISATPHNYESESTPSILGT